MLMFLAPLGLASFLKSLAESNLHGWTVDDARSEHDVAVPAEPSARERPVQCSADVWWKCFG